MAALTATSGFEADQSRGDSFSGNAMIPNFGNEFAGDLWALQVGASLQAYQQAIEPQAVKQADDERLEEAAQEARFQM